MNTYIKILLSLIIINLVSSCEEESKIKHPQKKLLVFVDLSTSLDSIAIKSQANKLSQIIVSLPYNTIVDIYPMDLSVHQDKLLNDTIPDEPEHEVRKSRINEKKQKFATEVKNVLFETYIRRSKKKKNDIKSCIISSLEMAFNNLPENNDLLKQTQLVFMTDRIEQCPQSIAGNLYMCSSTKEPSFDKIIDQIQQDYNPKKKLGDKLSEGQVHFVITSSYGNQSKCLDESELDEIWNEVFVKQGFQNPEMIYQKTSPPNLW